MNQTAVSAFIWSVADILRGDYKQSEYGRVILPFTLLRRLDCVLAPMKAAVLKEQDARKGADIPIHEFLIRKAKQSFYSASRMNFASLRLADPKNVRKNLLAYIEEQSVQSVAGGDAGSRHRGSVYESE
jgi:type I restriction enzyme M protein